MDGLLRYRSVHLLTTLPVLTYANHSCTVHLFEYSLYFLLFLPIGIVVGMIGYEKTAYFYSIASCTYSGINVCCISNLSTVTYTLVKTIAVNNLIISHYEIIQIFFYIITVCTYVLLLVHAL